MIILLRPVGDAPQLSQNKYKASTSRLETFCGSSSAQEAPLVASIKPRQSNRKSPVNKLFIIEQV